MENKKCISCHSNIFNDIIDLGIQPWCNGFLKKDEFKNEKKYPLKLIQCQVCSLLQLSYFVPKETMFKDHTYLSGTTKTLAKHFYDLAEENLNQFNLQKNDLIVDIGGNDGTQLAQYKKLGLNNLLNVESADNIAKISLDNGIPVLNKFFNQDSAREILNINSISKHKFLNNNSDKAKLINASGVFFHLEELHSVCRGIKLLLNDNGIFVVQFMYAKSMMETNAFDTIYHEHLCYYTIKSLSYLLSQYNLEIFDAYFSPIHSGSMIAKVCHRDSKINIPTARFDLACKNELIHSNDKLINKFVKNITTFKNEFVELINKLNNDGKIIYTMGAPAKGNTLLNYCNMNNSLIKKAIEVNNLKVGLYTPGTHIPIEMESTDDLPDYFLLLSHNFIDEIISKFKDKNVKFIVPFKDKILEII